MEKVFRTHLEHLFDGGRDGNRIVKVICEQHEHRRKAFRDVVRTRYLRKVRHMQTSKASKCSLPYAYHKAAKAKDTSVS